MSRSIAPTYFAGERRNLISAIRILEHRLHYGKTNFSTCCPDLRYIQISSFLRIHIPNFELPKLHFLLELLILPLAVAAAPEHTLYSDLSIRWHLEHHGFKSSFGRPKHHRMIVEVKFRMLFFSPYPFPQW